MIYDEVDIYFFPHLNFNYNDLKNKKIVRVIFTCNKKKIFSNEIKEKLLNLDNQKKEIQIELPVLSQLIAKDIKENENFIRKYNLKLIINCYGGINLLSYLNIDIYLGRLFFKTMNKYPYEYVYPRGILMNFDIINNLYSDKLVITPFQLEFYKKISTLFNIKGFDIEKRLFNLLETEIINELKDIADIYILNESFGATADNCTYKYFNTYCNQSECSKKFYFHYVNMGKKENEIIPISFFSVGQNVYFSSD